MEYVPDYDQVFIEISKEVKPNPSKVQRRIEFEGFARKVKGVKSVFWIIGHSKGLSSLQALLFLKGKLKESRPVVVKWGKNSREAKKGRISKEICSLDDFFELIEEIKKLQS